MSTLTTPTDFIALFDLHVGWEYVREAGGLKLRRADNPAAIKTAMSFINDYHPNCVILGGDQLHCGPVSHWNKGKPKLGEGLKLKRELDLFEETILTPIDDKCARTTRKIWLQGNHERFLDDFIIEHPGIEGMLGIAEYCRLKDRGWEFIDHGEIAKLGKLHFVHGDKIGGGTFHAKRAVEVYGRNIRFGHHHTWQVSPKISAVDIKDRHTAVAVPCLASRNPGYASNRPNNWINGWLWGHVAGTGTFWDQVAVLTNNQYFYNGRVYQG